MDSIIYTRVKELCKEKGISISKLESELGVSQYSINKWKNTSSPTVDKISRVARYLNVSIDYLVGATDIRSPADSLMQDEDFVSLQRSREKMTERDKNRMMSMMRIVFDYAFSDEEDKNSGNSKLLDD